MQLRLVRAQCQSTRILIDTFNLLDREAVRVNPPILLVMRLMSSESRFAVVAVEHAQVSHLLILS
jgi:hypothetical protein